MAQACVVTSNARPAYFCSSCGALRAALKTKEVLAGLAAQSVDPGGLTPAEFARQIKADYERWGPIVKESGFTPVD